LDLVLDAHERDEVALDPCAFRLRSDQKVDSLRAVVASVHLAEANGADDVGGRDPARGCDRGGNTAERQ
jgi:hypothetical protein